ncbi:5'-nucleotidase domain-containing protein 2 [Armadillidium nasatum]|uniref:5'-nucleotidase domain-containing protein 2 n=1 Tax=Armadillidium nasatum TaxID=96803 RepID=A0A5N5SIZ1_9CRUS|nr:5'-nucleotidase domain-containing protein 2 [Armadillidium nasatum]
MTPLYNCKGPLRLSSFRSFCSLTKPFCLQHNLFSLCCKSSNMNSLSNKTRVITFVTQSKSYSTESLRKFYAEGRSLWEKKKLPEDINSSVVFASNELDLGEIKVYGFDYDYTIAQYSPSVEKLIYDLGKKALISKYRYPKEIESLEYNRSYAVRGLHYDIQNGLLMKLDQFQQIQIGSIYRGLTHVSMEEVRKIYGSKALSLGYVEGHLRGSAIGSIHPEMHRIVGQDVPKYLVRDPKLVDFFQRLKRSGKETFIITNSPYYFVDLGMTFLLGENWQDYFDVVIAKAKKPDFFTDNMRPFRELVKEIHMTCWGPVKCLEKGKVYLEGNLSSLQEMKNWDGQGVLYFGDHPYSDLADVSLHHLWRTGAIIWELDDEIRILNSLDYKRAIGWLQILQNIIENCQDSDEEDAREVILEWTKERDELRKKTKDLFNPYFGSVFRTHDNPTYFSRRLFRFADIYTSRLSNLNNYSVKHTFYPRKVNFY